MAAAPGGLDEVELSSLKVIYYSETTLSAKNKLIVAHVLEFFVILCVG